MARKIEEMYSPFRPRPRKSARLVLIWMAILVVVLWLAYYLNHNSEARLENASRMRALRKGGSAAKNQD